MGIFGKMTEKFSGGAKRMSGKTDLLEAACAVTCLVGASDGDFSDDEMATALDRLTTHDILSKAFTTTQIEQAFDKQVRRIKQGPSGRLGLRREVEEAKSKSSHDDLEMIFVIGVDVAAADGDVGDKEMSALRQIGVSLGGFDPKAYLA